MAARQSIPYGRVPQPAGSLTGIAGKPRPVTTATPTVQYTPNDLHIPDNLLESIPNSEFLKKLNKAEQQLDLISTKKELDFHVIHAKSIAPSSFKRETGTLRVFIYNTCEAQPWQKQLAQQRGEMVNDDLESSWTLRIEGRYLSHDGKETPYRFSSFLLGLSVDLVANENYPSLQGNIIEWRNSQQQYPTKQLEFDGMDVKKPGVFDINAKIAILIKDQSNRLRLSDKLSQFIGKLEATQQEVIYSVWNYVLFKDLINKKNTSNIDAVTNATPVINEPNPMPEPIENDLTVIKCDAVLQDLLGIEQFRFSQLYQLIQPHFQPRQPIVLDYLINTKKSSTLGDLVLDIPVELPMDVIKQQKELSDEHKKIFGEANQITAQIAELNNKIGMGISKLKNLDSRRQFYQELQENPVEFIKKWTEIQLETLKSLKSDEGYNEEIVRRAEYFEQNEDVLKQKIDILLGSTKY